MNAVARVLLIYPVIQLSDKINALITAVIYYHVCLKTNIQTLFSNIVVVREKVGQKQLMVCSSDTHSRFVLLLTAQGP